MTSSLTTANKLKLIVKRYHKTKNDFNIMLLCAAWKDTMSWFTEKDSKFYCKHKRYNPMSLLKAIRNINQIKRWRICRLKMKISLIIIKKQKSDSEIILITSLAFYLFHFQILPKQFQQLEKIIFGSKRFLSTTVYGAVASQLLKSFMIDFLSFLSWSVLFF